MCAVSGILNWGRQYIPPSSWTPMSFDTFKKLMELAKAVDASQGVEGCADAEKL